VTHLPPPLLDPDPRCAILFDHVFQYVAYRVIRLADRTYPRETATTVPECMDPPEIDVVIHQRVHVNRAGFVMLQTNQISEIRVPPLSSILRTTDLRV
jgi:hypothetical protein